MAADRSAYSATASFIHAQENKKTGPKDLLSEVEIAGAGNSSLMEIPTEDHAAGGRQDENKSRDAVLTGRSSPFN